MNKYDKLYDEIQNGHYLRGEQLAKTIIQEVEKQLGFHFQFQQTADYTNQLLALIATKYQPYFLPLLEKYGYSYFGEMQHIIRNMGFFPNPQGMIKFPNCLGCQMIPGGYVLETTRGNITVYYASQYFSNLKPYILLFKCHSACLDVLHGFGGLSASTGLIDLPLGGKHYHSFINYGNGIIDLAHNAYLSKDDYDLAFHPEVLNTVTADILEEEEKRINQQESLSKPKQLLLRLALDKQIKKKEA